MTILGIERITYGVTDLDTCRRFFADWGLKEVAHDETLARFETLNGCEVLLALASDPALPPAFASGPTLRWKDRRSRASPVTQVQARF